jgi:hypothetical protein
MTTIISRLYADPAAANDVVAGLSKMGMPAANYDVIAADADVDALTSTISAARVRAKAAQLYAAHLASKGGALVVVRAPFSPIGAARAAMDVVDGVACVDVGVANQNDYQSEAIDPQHFLSVLTDHPRFASHDLRPGYSRVYGPVTELFGLRLLSRPKARTSAIRGGGFMSRMFWPMPLVTRNRTARSASGKAGHVSRVFWPMPLIAKRGAS